MKLLLLVTLLTAGTTAQSISPQPVWQFHNMIKCIIPRSHPLLANNDYACYCGTGGSDTPMDDLDRCCQTQEHCYDQVKGLGRCKQLINNPYTTSYSYSCSGSEITCSDKNNVCEDFICNCDRQAAICFSRVLYNKEEEE
ncbi:phospholipase A2 isoform X1, partial [Cricetulus griseus]|uniref:phospholipase A2 isoform X1 n=1 Tax=Cricetulus griseus TaxID=10029 RepID=UPI00022F5FCC